MKAIGVIYKKNGIWSVETKDTKESVVKKTNHSSEQKAFYAVPRRYPGQTCFILAIPDDMNEFEALKRLNEILEGK